MRDDAELIRFAKKIVAQAKSRTNEKRRSGSALGSF